MKKALTKAYILDFMDAMDIFTIDQVTQMQEDIYDWIMFHKEELETTGLTLAEFKGFINMAYSNAELLKHFQQNNGFMFGRFKQGG